jgi:hypothetical protein
MTLDDIRLCNCAACGCDLLGDTMHGYIDTVPDLGELPPFVFGRISGRTYCEECFEEKTTPQGRWEQHRRGRQ